MESANATHLSNILTPLATKNQKRIERLAISSRKRRCLFGTMEVKVLSLFIYIKSFF